MLGYAIGLYIMGNVGDKLNPRYFYGFGLMATSMVYYVTFFVKYSIEGFHCPMFFKTIMFISGIF